MPTTVEPGDTTRTIQIITNGTSFYVTKVLLFLSHHEFNIQLLQCGVSDKDKLPGAKLVPIAILPNGDVIEDSTEILKAVQREFNLESPPCPEGISEDELADVATEVGKMYWGIQLIITCDNESYNNFDFCGNYGRFLPPVVKCCPCCCTNSCCKGTITDMFQKPMKEAGCEFTSEMKSAPVEYVKTKLLTPIEERLTKTQRFLIQDAQHPTNYDYELLAFIDPMVGTNGRQFHSPVCPKLIEGFPNLQTWYQRMFDITGLQRIHFGELPRRPLNNYPQAVSNPGKAKGKPAPIAS